MKNSLQEKFPVLLFIIALVAGALVSNAQEAPRSGPIRFEYNYPANKPVRYMTESKVIQTMDVMGQSMQVNVNSVFGCTIRAVNSPDKNLKLEVTVDTIGQSTESPMGSTGGSIKEVQGRVFNIVIDHAGKSVDISEAKNIIYNIEGSGESNLSETFINFFPVLPSNPVKTGDTWNTSDSINTTTSAMSMKMLVNAENKLEGFETVNGVECAKISAVLTGTRTMDIRSQEMDIKIKGPFTGTADFYFSPKDGYFIRQVVFTKMTGNLEMSMPEPMSIPVVMDMNSVNEVKK